MWSSRLQRTFPSEFWRFCSTVFQTPVLLLKSFTLFWSHLSVLDIICTEHYSDLISLSGFFFSSMKFWNVVITYFVVNHFSFIVLDIRRLFQWICTYPTVLVLIFSMIFPSYCFCFFWNSLERHFTSLTDLQFLDIFIFFLLFVFLFYFLTFLLSFIFQPVQFVCAVRECPLWSWILLSVFLQGLRKRQRKGYEGLINSIYRLLIIPHFKPQALLLPSVCL